MADQTTNKPVKADPKAQQWIDKLARYDRAFKTWEKRAKTITERYRDYDHKDGSKKNSADFNILWANIQVLMPATFARVPRPDVSRRWRDNDPVGRVAALLLERALTFEIDHYPDYKASMKQSVLDRFLGGRGTSWARYEANIAGGAPADQVTDDASAPPEYVDKECAPTDYVHWKDFKHEPVRTWEECTWVSRDTYQTRAELVKRFGEDGKLIPLDKKPQSALEANDKAAGADQPSLGLVQEIWDKTTGTALWLSPSLGRILDERPDPLGLEGFFPCPQPLYATLTNDTLVPVPDYKMYQDQAKQLDKLAAKIDGLIEMLQVKGVHDAAVPELARLFKEAGNGDLIPVNNFQVFAEKNGLAGSIDIFDISPIVAALNEAYQAQEGIKQTIYELMGVSDITRGASDPQETYGAQKLKGQYGNMRLRSKQDEVVCFATSLLQLKAQIMCQHFQPQTFLKAAAADQLSPEDQQLIPQALQLLMGERAFNPEASSDSPLRSFRIEISSDSMVQMDEQQEKGERLEFINTFTGYMEKVAPAVQENPQLAPLAVAMLKFGVSGFKVGKTMEGIIDQMLDQMVKQAAQPQPPKPDPEQIKVQGMLALEDKKLANAKELEQFKSQQQAAVDANAQNVQAQQNAHQNELENQRHLQQAQLDALLEKQRMAYDDILSERDKRHEENMAVMRGKIDLLMNRENNENRLEVAEISAATTLQAAQVSAAEAASKDEEK